MIKIYNTNLELQAILKHVPSAELSEEINREFTFSFETVIDGEKSPYITHNNIVEVEGNYFNIVQYRKERTNTNQLLVSVECEHVSYDLIDEKLETFTQDGTATDVLNALLAGTSFSVGKVEPTSTQTISILEESNKRAVLIDVAKAFGGELRFRKYTIDLLNRRGADNGTQFRVGKNLRGIKKEVDAKELDASGNPKISYDVDVVELSELPEYGDLEKMELGDTVRVIDPDLEVNTDARIVRYSYNPLLKINSHVEIANFIENVTDNIADIQRTTIVKERLYNGIRIGPNDGFVATRSDDKARTMMNATEGIKIQKGDGSGSTWEDVFYADTEGNLILTGRIEAGEFVGGTIDIGNGAFQVDDTGNVTITTGSIDLGSGTFAVDNQGNLTATSATIEGTIQSSEVVGSEITGGVITGALIQTSESNYPRIELSSSNEVLRAMGDLNSLLSIDASFSGNPTLYFEENGYQAFINMAGTDLFIGTPLGQGEIQISSGDDLRLSADQTIYLDGHVDFTGSVTGLSTDFEPDHNHGIPDGTYLLYGHKDATGNWVVDGGIEWVPSGGHSHSVD